MCQQTCKFLLEHMAPLLKELRSPCCTHKMATLDWRLVQQERVDCVQLLLQKLKNNESHFSHFTENKELTAAMAQGLGFHHAGLHTTERETVELAFRMGTLSIIAATSTLAAGVNLPAGRVLIRSLMIGREFLNVVQYRQMAGRAGRAGQTSFGESYLLVKKSERDRALALCCERMPTVQSQLNPALDNGNALLKALLEVFGLEMVQSREDCQRYLEQTFLYQQCRTAEEQQCALQSMHLLLSFLLETGMVIESSAGAAATTAAAPAQLNGAVHPSAAALPAPQKRILKLSRFGRAIMQSNVNLDEAIVLYESLLRAQDGLNLECNLHILYLLTPLTQAIYPNFRKLLSVYEASNKSKQRIIASIIEYVGIDYASLNRWQVRPPSKTELDACTDAMRLFSLRNIQCAGNENKVKNGSGSNGSSSAKTSNSNGIDASIARSTLTREEWRMLVACKRLWCASILQAVLDNKPLELIAKEYEVSVSDIEALQSQTRIMSRKVQKVCNEIGWSSFARMFKEFHLQLEVEIAAELKSLMDIPNMTPKIARILVDNKISDAAMFVAADSRAMAQYLRLSIGFELKELDAFELKLQENEDGDDGLVDFAAEEASSPAADRKLTKDEELVKRLTNMLSALQASGRAMLHLTAEKTSKQMTEVLRALDHTHIGSFRSAAAKGAEGADGSSDDGSEDGDEDASTESEGGEGETDEDSDREGEAEVARLNAELDDLAKNAAAAVDGDMEWDRDAGGERDADREMPHREPPAAAASATVVEEEFTYRERMEEQLRRYSPVKRSAQKRKSISLHRLSITPRKTGNVGSTSAPARMNGFVDVLSDEELIAMMEELESSGALVACEEAHAAAAAAAAGSVSEKRFTYHCFAKPQAPQPPSIATTSVAAAAALERSEFHANTPMKYCKQLISAAVAGVNADSTSLIGGGRGGSACYDVVITAIDQASALPQLNLPLILSNQTCNKLDDAALMAMICH